MAKKQEQNQTALKQFLQENPALKGLYDLIIKFNRARKDTSRQKHAKAIVQAVVELKRNATAAAALQTFEQLIGQTVIADINNTLGFLSTSSLSSYGDIDAQSAEEVVSSSSSSSSSEIEEDTPDAGPEEVVASSSSSSSSEIEEDTPDAGPEVAVSDDTQPPVLASTTTSDDSDAGTGDNVDEGEVPDEVNLIFDADDMLAEGGEDGAEEVSGETEVDGDDDDGAVLDEVHPISDDLDAGIGEPTLESPSIDEQTDSLQPAVEDPAPPSTDEPIANSQPAVKGQGSPSTDSTKGAPTWLTLAKPGVDFAKQRMDAVKGIFSDTEKAYNDAIDSRGLSLQDAAAAKAVVRPLAGSGISVAGLGNILDVIKSAKGELRGIALLARLQTTVRALLAKKEDLKDKSYKGMEPLVWAGILNKAVRTDGNSDDTKALQFALGGYLDSPLQNKVLYNTAYTINEDGSLGEEYRDVDEYVKAVEELHSNRDNLSAIVTNKELNPAITATLLENTTSLLSLLSDTEGTPDEASEDVLSIVKNWWKATPEATKEKVFVKLGAELDVTNPEARKALLARLPGLLKKAGLGEDLSGVIDQVNWEDAFEDLGEVKFEELLPALASAYAKLSAKGEGTPWSDAVKRLTLNEQQALQTALRATGKGLQNRDNENLQKAFEKLSAFLPLQSVDWQKVYEDTGKGLETLLPAAIQNPDNPFAVIANENFEWSVLQNNEEYKALLGLDAAKPENELSPEQASVARVLKSMLRYDAVTPSTLSEVSNLFKKAPKDAHLPDFIEKLSDAEKKTLTTTLTALGDAMDSKQVQPKDILAFLQAVNVPLSEVETGDGEDVTYGHLLAALSQEKDTLSPETIAAINSAQGAISFKDLLPAMVTGPDDAFSRFSSALSVATDKSMATGEYVFKDNPELALIKSFLGAEAVEGNEEILDYTVGGLLWLPGIGLKEVQGFSQEVESETAKEGREAGPTEKLARLYAKAEEWVRANADKVEWDEHHKEYSKNVTAYQALRTAIGVKMQDDSPARRAGAQAALAAAEKHGMPAETFAKILDGVITDPDVVNQPHAAGPMLLDTLQDWFDTKKPEETVDFHQVALDAGIDVTLPDWASDTVKGMNSFLHDTLGVGYDTLSAAGMFIGGMVAETPKALKVMFTTRLDYDTRTPVAEQLGKRALTAVTQSALADVKERQLQAGMRNLQRLADKLGIRLTTQSARAAVSIMTSPMMTKMKQMALATLAGGTEAAGTFAAQALSAMDTLFTGAGGDYVTAFSTLTADTLDAEELRVVGQFMQQAAAHRNIDTGWAGAEDYQKTIAALQTRGFSPEQYLAVSPYDERRNLDALTDDDKQAFVTQMVAKAVQEEMTLGEFTPEIKYDAEGNVDIPESVTTGYYGDDNGVITKEEFEELANKSPDKVATAYYDGGGGPVDAEKFETLTDGRKYSLTQVKDAEGKVLATKVHAPNAVNHFKAFQAEAQKGAEYVVNTRVDGATQTLPANSRGAAAGQKFAEKHLADFAGGTRMYQDVEEGRKALQRVADSFKSVRGYEELFKGEQDEQVALQLIGMLGSTDIRGDLTAQAGRTARIAALYGTSDTIDAKRILSLAQANAQNAGKLGLRPEDVGAINELQANMWWGGMHRADGVAVDINKLYARTSEAAARVFNSRDKETLTWLMTTNSELLSDELQAIKKKVQDGVELTAEEHELLDAPERLRRGFLGTDDEWIRSRDADTLQAAFHSLDDAGQNAVLREASRGNLLEERKKLLSYDAQANAWQSVLPNNYVFHKGTANILKGEGALNIPAAANALLEAGMTTWRIQEVLSGQGAELSDAEIDAIRKVKGEGTAAFVNQLRGMRNLTNESKRLLYRHLGASFDDLFRNAGLDLESYNYSSYMAVARLADREAELQTLFGANASSLQSHIDSDASGGRFVGEALQGVLLQALGGGAGGTLDATQLEAEIDKKGLRALWLVASTRTRTPEAALQLITGKSEIGDDEYRAIAGIMGIPNESMEGLPEKIFRTLHTSSLENINTWASAYQGTEAGKALVGQLKVRSKAELQTAMGQVAGANIPIVKVPAPSMLDAQPFGNKVMYEMAMGIKPLPYSAIPEGASQSPSEIAVGINSVPDSIILEESPENPAATAADTLQPASTEGPSTADSTPEQRQPAGPVQSETIHGVKTEASVSPPVLERLGIGEVSMNPSNNGLEAASLGAVQPVMPPVPGVLAAGGLSAVVDVRVTNINEINTMITRGSIQ